MNKLVKKVCFVTALAGASLAVADTTVMSWLVDMSTAEGDYQNIDFAKLRLYAQDQEGNKTVLQIGEAVGSGYGTPPTTWSTEVELPSDEVDAGTPHLAGPYYAKLSEGDEGLTTTGANNYSEYLFFIELLDAQSNVVGWESRGQYASEAIAAYFGDDLNPSQEMSAMGTLVFGSNVVPEPTSGLLLLVGGALLALRRRRRTC